VREQLDQLFDDAEGSVHYDAFAASLDQIYFTLREDPYQGDPQADVVVNGKEYTTRVYSTHFLVVLFFLDENERLVTILRPSSAPRLSAVFGA
jgi:hypothetical protein